MQFFAVVAWILISVWSLVTGCIKTSLERYAVRNLDMTFRFGLFSKSEEVVSFSRVQGSATDNSMLDRLFRLGTLKFFQAGDE